MNREDDLEKQILKHKKAYYDGEPIISDEAYDALEAELASINPDNPVLHLVGTPQGGKVKHDPLMLSSQKATEVEEVMKWFKDSKGADLFFGYKIDGLSLSILYENGRLKQGATRGNGEYGDDVTFAVYYVNEIPKTLPETSRINVRGEVYMKISEFNILKNENPDFTSPRNLAAGTLKQKDTTILLERRLHFMAWGLEGMGEDLSLDEQITILKKWGFETADIKKLENVTEQMIADEFEKIIHKRDLLDFELDGVMFKYNDAEDRKSAGYTQHHPKWQIALKFKSKGGISTIKDITWQVGRTGVLTPVAEIEPVEIAGATIQRCTLHNADFLIEMDVAIADEVFLERSGDVIPKIIEVTSKGPNHVTLPTTCPSCDAIAEKQGVNLVCTGDRCKDRELRNIEHWIKTVDIKGLGPKNVEKLFDEGIINHFSDLYSEELTEERLVKSLGKNGEKIYKEIDKSRNIDFSIFLASLGITQLGKKLGKDLANHFPSLEALQNASVSDLVEIEGISDLTAEYILDGINDPSVVDRVLFNDISIVYSSEQVTTPRETKGKVYVTGKVSGMTKKELEEKVIALGYEWSTSISKALTYLVSGEKPGGAKIEKALKAGIPIVTWNEFIKRTNE
ncbi:MAG: NAD-dependent DNA ligase LigA [Candidatus Heimdallarchaeota archaeon]|nr:NAD-dependent DNA ligase LigA [Candidatus Heimdallarchaeota archaeon]